MKNWLLVGVVVLLLVDICFQGSNIYYRYVQRKPVEITVKENTKLDLTNHPIQGNVNASKIVVEFGDYECPYCLQYAKETLPILRQRFVDTGMIRYAYIHCPLPIHRNAILLATAAICADKQNRYWAMHDMLIARKPATYFDIMKMGEALGLDDTELSGCMIDAKSEIQIKNDIQQARDLGLQLTPSFAVGTINPSGQVLVERLIIGAQPLTVFERAIGNIRVR